MMTRRTHPVSYTHLDVYKRQVRSSAFMLMFGIIWVSLLWMYFTEVRPIHKSLHAPVAAKCVDVLE